MSNKSLIAFIVEGENQEPQKIIGSMSRIYFSAEQCKIITLSAAMNIYMLWKQLKEDDFETDIIDVIRESNDTVKESLKGLTREDFEGVYLFFDYDVQHRTSTDRIEQDVLAEMLQNFNNETGAGKLYISYPMSEALRDYAQDQCTPATFCIWPQDRLNDYKRISGCQSSNSDILRYDYQHWTDILVVFVMRVSCLFDQSQVFLFDSYREKVTSISIYEQQQIHIKQEKIFVLSSFPQFLLDYFRKKFWLSQISNYNIRPLRSCTGHMSSSFELID